MPKTARKVREVSFRTSKADNVRIDRIVYRAFALHLVAGTKLDLEMDLSAVHANGMRMDFERLLDADDFNFAHDVCGIRRHIDRSTGKLLNCFVPRFHKPRTGIKPGR